MVAFFALTEAELIRQERSVMGTEEPYKVIKFKVP